MIREITFVISSRDKKVTFEDDDFYSFVEADFNGFHNNMKILSTEELLSRFMQKSADQYDDEKQMQRLINEIDDRLKGR